MWILILLAVHINNPNDIPARVEMRFNSEEQCLQALSGMTYWVKFESFKVVGQCKKS